jgi:hypothetical protein
VLVVGFQPTPIALHAEQGLVRFRVAFAERTYNINVQVSVYDSVDNSNTLVEAPAA